MNNTTMNNTTMDNTTMNNTTMNNTNNHNKKHPEKNTEKDPEKDLEVEMENDYLVIPCPHCYEKMIIYVKELNCHIFRHGVLKKNKQQINPHLNKQVCDFLFLKKLIYGCGKPFRIVKTRETKYKSMICGYI